MTKKGCEIEGMETIAVAVGDGEERVAILGSELASEGPVGRTLIVPWGQVNSSNGDFVLDEEAGQLVLDSFATHGTDLPIDYEHQSLGGQYASPTGQAPAAGWIKALKIVKLSEAGDVQPGLYAEVEWTAAAHAKLAAREYRYLSPVVIVRKRDRRVVSLHSAALTNKPAIVGMRPIVNSESGLRIDEGGVDKAERSADGELARNHSVAVNADKGLEVGDAIEMLRARLGLDEQASAAAVIVAAGKRLLELEEGVRRSEAEERVLAATRAGKLVPPQQDWAVALAMRDPAEFDQWAATAPVVVALGRTEPPKDAGADRKRAVVIASAKAAFHRDPNLELLTSEAAWVAQALRDAGIE